MTNKLTSPGCQRPVDFQALHKPATWVTKSVDYLLSWQASQMCLGHWTGLESLTWMTPFEAFENPEPSRYTRRRSKHVLIIKAHDSPRKRSAHLALPQVSPAFGSRTSTALERISCH